MVLLGCEVVIPLSSPTFLLSTLWAWLVSPILGFLLERVGGVFYQMNDYTLLVGGLKLISLLTLLRCG